MLPIDVNATLEMSVLMIELITGKALDDDTFGEPSHIVTPRRTTENAAKALVFQQESHDKPRFPRRHNHRSPMNPNNTKLPPKRLNNRYCKSVVDSSGSNVFALSTFERMLIKKPHLEPSNLLD